jgi:hypothetical protein
VAIVLLHHGLFTHDVLLVRIFNIIYHCYYFIIIIVVVKVSKEKHDNVFA